MAQHQEERPVDRFAQKGSVAGKVKTVRKTKKSELDKIMAGIKTERTTKE
jgi:hypothetical protein